MDWRAGGDSLPIESGSIAMCVLVRESGRKRFVNAVANASESSLRGVRRWVVVVVDGGQERNLSCSLKAKCLTRLFFLALSATFGLDLILQLNSPFSWNLFSGNA